MSSGSILLCSVFSVTGGVNWAVMAGLVFIGLLLNWWFNPTHAVLEQLDFVRSLPPVHFRS